MKMKSKVIWVGGQSKGIVIPQQICEGMGIKMGDFVLVEIKRVMKDEST